LRLTDGAPDTAIKKGGEPKPAAFRSGVQR
jgi:hypothetical protein